MKTLSVRFRVLSWLFLKKTEPRINTKSHEISLSDRRSTLIIISAVFQFILQLLRQIREEIVTRLLLDLSNRHAKFLPIDVLDTVLVRHIDRDHTRAVVDGHRRAARRQNYDDLPAICRYRDNAFQPILFAVNAGDGVNVAAAADDAASVTLE